MLLFFLPAISICLLEMKFHPRRRRRRFFFSVAASFAPRHVTAASFDAAPPPPPRHVSRDHVRSGDGRAFGDIPQQTALMCSRLTSRPRTQPAGTLRALTEAGALMRCDMLRSGFSQSESACRTATPSLRCERNLDFLSACVFFFPLDIYCWPAVLYLFLDNPGFP